jgi:cytoskeletal protein RodZ
VSIGNSPSDAPDAPDGAHASDAPGGAHASEATDATDAHDARQSIGRVLAQARLTAGLTVDELSTTTRVRVPIVQAIEQDDFTRCGGDVYARGHVRTLARAVGLEPGPLVARYDAEHGGRPAPTAVAPVYDTERIRPEPRSPNWTAAMIAAIVIVVAFVGFTMFSDSRGGSSPAAGHAPPPQTAVPSRPAHSTAPRTTPTPSAIAAAPAGKVTVKLTTTGDSWASVTDDGGNPLFEGLLHAGDAKTFTNDKRVNLVLGNGAAVQIFVNGKDLGVAGGDGQIVRTSFTPGDPQAG